MPLPFPALHEVQNAAGSFPQAIEGRRVGNPQEPRRVERLARRDRDARLVEQRPARTRRRFAIPSGDEQPGTSGKQVERAGGLAAPNRRRPTASRTAGRGGGGTRRASPCTGACGPVSAASAAFCVIDETFDVEWLWSAFAAATTARGPSAQPQRQPVIAYAFDADPPDTVRSRRRSTRIARQVVRHRVVDQLLVAQIEHDPDAARRRGVRDRRQRRLRK